MDPLEAVQLLDQWTENGGKFPDFHYHWCSTPAEAEAIVRALESGDLNHIDKFGPPALFHVVALMQGIFTEEADAILREKALPLIRQQLATAFGEEMEADEYRQERLDETHLFVLKNIAYYGDPKDVSLIVKAARSPRQRDTIMWSHILDYVHRSNPAADELLEALAKPLPTGFLRIAYLDFANSMCFDGRVETHPFDTPDAVSWMIELFENEDAGYDSYAVSATKSSSFLSPAAKEQIVAKAQSHPRQQIRDEAMWALARDPRENREGELISLALDPRFTTRAVQYLESLGRGSSVPATTKEPHHQALMRMSDWLSDEQDFWGQPPDSISLLDHRVLNWVPEGSQREVWLIEFSCVKEGEYPRGYSGIGAVWDDSLTTLMGEKSDIASLYVELLGESDDFPDEQEPEELLASLNPDLFGPH